ncbi:MAG: fumarylacetoacetate hydrolase family protein, partial [Sphingomonadaceae bacterium]|nr:fumarylacetoacetate hydrolase family protein [Sphingomonadaceae bacterium]
MRLVTCVHEGRTLLGSWIEGDSKVVDLCRAAQLGGGSDPAAFTSMIALIEAGEKAWDAARSLTANPPVEAVLDSIQCKLLSPLPMPTQVRDFLCFEG